ncbi:DNA/RNA polymerase [Peniophora sp. CONT]|nr:DNA/RNA polymerase [Peniophora sp. CONT]
MDDDTGPGPSQATASLLHRLAGPSSGKAGLAKDQSEINRIIAEASKGSPFYENEKRKDKEVTERIAKILQQRDDVLRTADLEKVKRKADAILEELEAERDLSQYIVHFDMDAFYANVELLDHPELAGKPFGVGSLRGVLTTASYDARAFGVRSGMAGFVAKKLCPELILQSNHFDRYSHFSKQVMSIFQEYDPNMLAASVDEAYLNITAYCHEHSLGPDECVETIRKRVVDTTKLTVSAGIAANKMLAKICSDKNKPNGQFHLPHDREAIVHFMHDLSIRKVPGIGRVNERILESIGVKTCGDIFRERVVLYLMDKQFGVHFLLRTHLGIASNVVQPHAREERKSIGSERTFNTISDKEQILKKLDEIATELEDDMSESGWSGRTITLKYKLDTFQTFTRAKSSDRYMSSKADLFAIGKELLLPEWPLRLRLIGLRVTKLKDLRKKDDGKGIKKFFAPTSVNASPSKKRKISDADVGEHDDADTMPGFHEDEGEEAWQGDGEDDALPLPQTASAHPRPPHSAPASSQPSTSELPQPSSSKPRSTAAATVSTQQVQETFECPICASHFKDNDALNAHIDWCLSREAIRSAQAEGDVPGNKGSGSSLKSNGTKTLAAKGGDSAPAKDWWKAPQSTGTGTSKRRKTKK